MNINQLINKLQQNHWIGYSLFWALVFLLNTGPHWEKYSSPRELIETIGLITGLQMLVAYIAIKHIMPFSLNTGRKSLFIVLLFGVLFIAAEINILVRVLYLEPTYSDSYELFLKNYGHKPLAERLISLWTLKYIFFSKIPLYIFPAAVIMAISFYRKQRDLLELSEQKKTAELKALKNQLNPHFIFNTLNNLYVLALKKSDAAPVVIEKLSDILDYILYRCNDKFVSVKNELALLNNYIDLEKIRYGTRLNINLKQSQNIDANIAPLILLSLVENACKHGTSEELNQANIAIDLTVENNRIRFKIVNSKPAKTEASSRTCIGLNNMTKQLELLYEDAYTLEVTETLEQYSVLLEVNSL